ncbi:2-amino-4-hydroxy-6-hydroxymethyldihydropteridine diphosphokinase [Mucilaginibacter flavidus]|uniref:2-amino-4-hydroxy-6- hydroxymethyldihydropteridine diphosphokinase n=1 Tax=Mucilaginibacter flavidus TaxID=2949309 RepID=UPI002093B584|nr:2-amino-4-hydroxy-6-hydroxymethyldihydropteridine diphosphokinase [Mucilaginibacter flavidus]MCO5948733.1 2-amino-4-hydroxy-6-hydroxymethyldihydropteridine diphosphokinase [Mucilaginibacter flavidus]
MNRVFLLLGSNLGNRQQHLQQAIELIGTHLAPVKKTSSIYETQSWGKTDAPDYLNQVVILETEIPASEILRKILDIELMLGRKREEKWGSRTIDIDILFYGDEIIDDKNLQVPHPELHNRRFTLEPLAEIAPGLLHPVLKKTILDVKNNLKDSLIVKKL